MLEAHLYETLPEPIISFLIVSLIGIALSARLRDRLFEFHIEPLNSCRCCFASHR